MYTEHPNAHSISRTTRLTSSPFAAKAYQDVERHRIARFRGYPAPPRPWSQVSARVPQLLHANDILEPGLRAQGGTVCLSATRALAFAVGSGRRPSWKTRPRPA